MLKTLEANSVQTCVTSPPYWGLRDYGVKGQLGLETTPDQYVNNMVGLFREVFRVLKGDGTLWLNLGDSYARNCGSAQGGDRALKHMEGKQKRMLKIPENSGLKEKDLVGIPWRVAFALQADGWYLRQDIVWHKPNPMPESVTDRCTKAHEYIFLLSKSPKYYFDHEAIKEPAKFAHEAIYDDGTNGHAGGRSNTGRGSSTRKFPADPTKRSRRSVWTVTTKPFKGAHFATFPPDLVEPCILAGSAKGDIVLDPFFGAGTTGLVAQKYDRKYLGIEINSKYIEIAEKRLSQTQLSLPEVALG